jgi:hypothetical protein
MKTYTSEELKSIRTVFGEDVEFDPNTGLPQEKGIGSKAQPDPHPTAPPPKGVKPASIEWLRRLVAACNDIQMQTEFERFLVWMNEDVLHRASILEIPIDYVVSPEQSNPIDPDTVHLYRSMLRGGKIAPPVEVTTYGEGLFQLQDGHHRLKAARAEGRRTIRAVIVADPLANLHKDRRD